MGWSPATLLHRRLSGLRRRLSGTWTSTIQVSWSKLDCFCIGRLSGTKGTVWQYTAIDVASAYTWATLQVTRRNPSAQWTSQLARTVAADLAARGWQLERVIRHPKPAIFWQIFWQAARSREPGRRLCWWA
jgi:hypothetical protein